jgi:hypothetical protein
MGPSLRRLGGARKTCRDGLLTMLAGPNSGNKGIARFTFEVTSVSKSLERRSNELAF